MPHRLNGSVARSLNSYSELSYSSLPTAASVSKCRNVVQHDECWESWACANLNNQLLVLTFYILNSSSEFNSGLNRNLFLHIYGWCF
jgi:hypothetical protein